jgi:hypothetical protein
MQRISDQNVVKLHLDLTLAAARGGAPLGPLLPLGPPVGPSCSWRASRGAWWARLFRLLGS